MYETFDERNNLLKRLDKVPFKNDEQIMIIYKTLGAYSVTSRESFFWQHMEKFLSEYENRQPVLPLTLTQDKNEPFLENILDALDKGYNI